MRGLKKVRTKPLLIACAGIGAISVGVTACSNTGNLLPPPCYGDSSANESCKQDARPETQVIDKSDSGVADSATDSSPNDTKP